MTLEPEQTKEQPQDAKDVQITQQTGEEKQVKIGTKETAVEGLVHPFDEGLIYGMDEPRQKSSKPFDEGLIYGVNIFEEKERIPDEDYDSGLITDDAEERFRAVNMKDDVQVKGRHTKVNGESKSATFKVAQVYSEDEYDSGLSSDEAEERYTITHLGRAVQIESTGISKEVRTSQKEQPQAGSTTTENESEPASTAVNVGDTTDNCTTDKADINAFAELRYDSDTTVSTISRVLTPITWNRPIITMKVSQQVDESEYENTTADEKPIMPIRRRQDVALRRSERVSFVEKNSIQRSTVSLADQHDKSADEANDDYDADYESYDNDDDDGDPYEPYEVSLADTIICMGFGYALVYS